MKRTLTVLMIEDSPDYVALVRAWLTDDEDLKFVVKWTDSLLKGLTAVAQGGLDVVLLDLGLPDSDGPATFAATRKYSQGVPIVVLSSNDSKVLAHRLVQEGARDYFVKSACSCAVLKDALRCIVGLAPN